MQMAALSRILTAATALLAVTGGPAARGVALEPARAFLDGLRARGLHDTALVYLDRARSSRLVPEDFKQTLPYEQGVTLFEMALRTEDLEIRDQRLRESETCLATFARAHPSDPLGWKTRDRLADVALQRGRDLLGRADVPSAKPQRERLLSEARALFDQVRVAAEKNVDAYTQALKKLPKLLDPKSESATIAQRDRLRAALLFAKLTAAAAIYERARTFPAESDEYRTQIGAAASRYGNLYQKYHRYRRPLPALYGRLWEGRCYLDLGNPEHALACCSELLALQPATDPAVRRLLAKAVVLKNDCLLRQKKYAQVIQVGTAWLGRVGDGEDRQPDELTVKYQVASAHWRQAEATKPSSPEHRRHWVAARALARDVVRNGGPRRQQARAILVRAGDGSKTERPTTTAGALEAAREALDRMKTAKMGLDLARKNNRDSVPQLKRQFVTARDSAADHLRQALRLADAKTPRDEVNRARYYLCYLNWERGRYYEAAVLGEFLARRYPSSAGARQGAKIAMASYQKLYAAPDNKTREFEARKIADLAKLITTQWPDQPEADTASAVLARFAVEQGQWRQARKYLDKIAPNRRGGPLRETGLAMWGRFLRSTRLDRDHRPTQDELDALKKTAQTLLEQGIQQAQGQEAVDEGLATAALSLAQIYLDSGKYGKAVTILEDPRIGPLRLVAAGNRVADGVPFTEETYKAALRAYIAVQPPRSEKIEQILDAMDRLAGKKENADAAERLTRIYLSLGGQLKDQLQRLRKADDQEAAQRATDALEVLLGHLRRRETGGDWATRNWIAQTYASLAAGVEAGRPAGQKLAPTAARYYTKAAEAYAAIREQSEQTPGFAPDHRAILAVMMRQAECLRRLGRFQEALDVLAALLARKPNMLDAQVAAAQTYQQRGDVEGPRWYPFAWRGDRPDKKTGKNRIWGWARIGQITARYRQYRALFFEARYNLALCREQYAVKQKGKEREKYLRLARSDLRFTRELYPDLGGETWRQKYDALLKRIQKRLGK